MLRWCASVGKKTLGLVVYSCKSLMHESINSRMVHICQPEDLSSQGQSPHKHPQFDAAATSTTCRPPAWHSAASFFLAGAQINKLPR
jgi:hypothetical protein